MPELPEVETARQQVERWANQRTILSARVPPSRLLGGAAPEVVAQHLEGARITGTERRGKHLLVLLDADRALYLHRGMSGRLRHLDAGAAEVRSERLRLTVEGGRAVVLEDPRMFGALEVGPRAALRARVFGPLGPDPLVDGLDARRLGERLRGARRPVKVALMDQERIAGLGNIQASEALWRARLHPALPAGELSAEALGRLAAAIHEALAHALADLAARDEVTYLSAAGESPFLVYGRAGERCSRCERASIAKMEQAGRSTYYCPRCQRGRRR